MVSGGGGFNLGTAYGKIVIDPSGVRPGVEQARRDFQSGIQSFQTGVQSLGNTVSNVGASLTLLTAPVVAFKVQGIAAASSFEDALAEIEVRAGLTTDQLEKVRTKALEIGRDTVFSAGQGADAFLQLLTTGQSVEEAFATIDAVMAGAAASGADLGYTADALTDIMAMFNLEAAQSGEVLDALAQASGASSATMVDLVQGFQNVGGVAKAFGLSVSETSAILATFSENGIKGAEAGTQLRSMLNNMSRDVPEVRDTWAALGVSMFDATGAARPLNDVIRDLNRAMDGMSDQERIKIVQTLAGTYGQLGLNALLASDGFGDMEAAMAGAADAQTIADAKMKTFSGSIMALRGSIETLQINALTPLMEDMAVMNLRMADIVSRVNDWVVANPELAKQIVRVLSLVTVLGPVLFVLGKIITAASGVIAVMAAAIGVLLSPIGLLIAAVGALYVAYRNNFMGIRDIIEPIIAQVVDSFNLFVRAMQAGLTVGQGVFLVLVKMFGPKATADILNGLNRIRQTVVNTFNAIRRAIEPVRQWFSELAASVGGGLGGIDLSQLINIGKTLLSLFSPLGRVLTLLKALGIDVVGTLIQGLKGLPEMLATLTGGGDLFDALRAGFGDSSFITGLEAAFIQLVSFIQTNVTPIFEAFWNPLVEGWNILSPALDQFFDWFMVSGMPLILSIVGQFIDALGGIWAMVAPGLASLLAWFVTTGLPLILTFIDTVVMPAFRGFVDLVAGFWAFVQPGLQALYNWFVTQALPAIVGFINTVVIPGVKRFIDVLVGFWTAIQPGLQAFFDWVTVTALPMVVDYFNNVISPVIATFIDILATIWEIVGPVLAELFNWFMLYGLPFITAAVQWFNTNILTPLVNLIAGIWEAVRPALQSLGTWFVTTGLPAIRNALTWFRDNVLTPLITALSNIWNSVRVGLEAFKNGISSIFNWIRNNVIQPILNMITQVQNALNSLVGGLGAAGGGLSGIGGLLGSGQINLGDLLNAIGAEFKDDGGAVTAGMPYLVSPKAGPELFVPQTSGTAIPNFDQFLRSAMAGAGNNGDTFNFAPGSVVVQANSHKEGAAAADGFMERLHQKRRAKG